MYEYFDWAKSQLDPSRKPSVYDWSQMNMREMADRALAICEIARSSKRTGFGGRATDHYIDMIMAHKNFEKMALAMKEKTVRRPRRGVW